jgi:hypothetical protein
MTACTPRNRPTILIATLSAPAGAVVVRSSADRGYSGPTQPVGAPRPHVDTFDQIELFLVSRECRYASVPTSMPDLTPKADIDGRSLDVRFVPFADISYPSAPIVLLRARRFAHLRCCFQGLAILGFHLLPNSDRIVWVTNRKPEARGPRPPRPGAFTEAGLVRQWCACKHV